MNDEELPMRAETASAYLDGELDAADRASAATDPHTMALVDSFSRIRATLGEVEPAAVSTRTAALAAALAEFDTLRAAPAATPASEPILARVTSMPFRRVRAYRLLTGFAAAAVVVVVAVAALNGTRSNDKSASSGTQAAAPSDAAAELPASKSADTTAAAAETAAPLAGGVSADSASAVLPEIDSADELARFASGIEAQPAAGLPPSSGTTEPQSSLPSLATTATIYSRPDCLTSNDLVIGDISVRGIPALAIRDATDGALRAVGAFDCRVLIPAVP